MRLIVVMAICAWVVGASTASAQQPAPDQRRLETGARLYGQHCTTCHGPGGDLAPGVNLKIGQFKRVKTDLEIMDTVLKGVPGTAMPATRLASGDLVALVAYIRAMKDYGARKVTIGNAANGKSVVEGKGGCLKCHRVGTTGSYTGPDLTDIGAALPAATIEDMLIDPNAAAQPGQRTIRAVMKNGDVVTGRRLNEDTWSVQIMDTRERLVSIWKPDVKEYEILKSPMPSYRDTLTAEERSDVVAYLLSLQPARSGGAGRGGRGGAQ
jgi:putative heme-binding domain-containing protein